MTPEGKIKAMFNKGLAGIKERYPGKLWRRMPVTRGMGDPWLDYHLCVSTGDYGHTIAVEAKRDAHHDLTPQQKQTSKELVAAGATVLVIYDKETVDSALFRIEKILYHAYGAR